MSAAAERTKHIPIGVDVTVPIGGRYHPAIVAQAFSTLDRLYPNRILLGVGSGEAMSERRFMGYWPRWQERTDRLVEALEFMRRLWTEEDFFDFYGKYFKMEKAFLYVKPSRSIPIYFSALGKKSAYIAGRHGDHLITSTRAEQCRNVIFPSFELGAKSVNKDLDKMDKAVLISSGIGCTDAVLDRIRRIIAGATVQGMFNEPDPRRIEAAAAKISDEKLKNMFYVCSKPDEMIDTIDKFRLAGADHVIISDFSPDIEETIEIFRTKIIPYFRGK